MAENQQNKNEQLIDEACKAYGIDRQYVLGARVDKTTGEAVVVTHGGAKVRYKPGDKPEKLGYIRVTGINPEAKKRKPITGGGKK